jgi:hypothetical protein
MNEERSNWGVLREAIAEHKRIAFQVKANANTMADLLEDQLENVEASKLRRIKEKLRRFNMVTGEWKR